MYPHVFRQIGNKDYEDDDWRGSQSMSFAHIL